jgi:4-hydroxymandelate oxidase
MAAEAEARLPKAAFDYYAGGSGTEWTLAENERAFRRWVFRRRVLVDVSEVDTAVTVLGQRLPFPVLLAPVALQRMAHAEGELATARAAAEAGTTMILSTLSSTTIEDVAATGVDRWFQLYVHRDRGLTGELIDRAVASGYRALVLTVDTPQLGRRDRDERNGFLPPPGVDLAILTSTTGGLSQQTGAGGGSSLFAYFARQCDPSVTWADVEWVRSRAQLPVVLKGVTTAEDARRAADAGVAAVSVSNHGGRQLDGDPATIDALPEVADEVGDRLDVLVDGGVRRGTDVLCALALGAKAVLIGRPQLWGLACGGQAGVGRVLDLLRMDFTLAMRLAGVTSTAAIGRSLVRRAVP